MIIKPQIRNNICLSAHPVGCERQVEAQIEYVKKSGTIDGPKKVLVIGSSNGYGLASRIVAAFGFGAKTVGVAYEKEGSEIRTATAGWYNEQGIKKLTEKEGVDSYYINGDAFSDSIKEQTLALIKEKLGPIDLLVYSIASPRRLDPDTGELYTSVLKPLDKAYTSKLMDFKSGGVSEVTIEPATDAEVAHTIKVMGGEDWKRWVVQLKAAGLLSEKFLTLAFSYVGPEITAPIYRQGTIGRAKEHLENTVMLLNKELQDVQGRAYVSVNKALVTRASSVIPGVSVYISLLYKVMKRKGTHEGCIEQIYRLFKEFVYTGQDIPTDEKGLIRLDDWEMAEDVQSEVNELWKQVTAENCTTIGDIEGFLEEFMRHHGFGIQGVDYSADIDV